MRSRRLLILAFVLAATLFWSALPPSVAQSGGGTMYVNTDYELFGTDPLNGGGHVTWTLTGGVAQGLRERILEMFDGYAQVPRGFRYGFATTDGNGDGTLQTAEGLAYTDRVELELEGHLEGDVGSQVGYFHLSRSDLLDKDPSGGFARSTAGLVGTGANATQDVVIRFLYNGESSTSDTAMPLATTVYADALYNVFSLDAESSPTFSGLSGYSPAWPLLVQGGWKPAQYDGRYALYAGNGTACSSNNVTACLYYPGTDAATNASLFLASATPSVDLRFATSAWVTFNYTGQVAKPEDALALEVATAPSYTNWNVLPNATLSQAQNTPVGSWNAASVDLSPYAGQQVRLRLRFRSGLVGTGVGFFVSDFAIHAPSGYLGPLVQNDAHYLIGVLSFSEFNVPDGNSQLIRTPGGEVLLDYLSWDTASAPPPDTIHFRTFDAAENPQVLFAVMLIAAYVISRMQDDAFDRYREAYPVVYRPAVHRVKWLHWVGRASAVVLVLFYFLPNAFYAIGLRVSVGGIAYWFLAASLVLGVGLGTRAYYKQLLEEAPPPPGPEASAPPMEPVAEEEEAVVEEPKVMAHCTHCLKVIHEGETTYTCTCGAVYHIGCAGGLMRCSSCRKPIAGIGVVGDKKAVSMRCASCGEVQSIPDGTDPRTVPCASCGGILRPLDAGKRYLLVASNPAIAFGWMKDLAKGKKPVLCFSPAAPDRLRLEFGLKDVSFVRVSSKAPDALDPKKLDSAGLKPLLPFAREAKGGVLVYDGLDQIISESTLGDVIRFLRKANDMAFVHGVTVIGRVGPGVLSEDEIQRLREEFDELLDLSAKL